LNQEIKVIKEEIDDIQGSYLMIDQLGRFYESSSGKHVYSDAILEKGVDYCLNQINPNINKFIAREGNYSTLKTQKRA
jgi:radical S-adenosyl methionine domain-containing protein 2